MSTLKLYNSWILSKFDRFIVIENIYTNLWIVGQRWRNAMEQRCYINKLCQNVKTVIEKFQFRVMTKQK